MSWVAGRMEVWWSHKEVVEVTVMTRLCLETEKKYIKWAPENETISSTNCDKISQLVIGFLNFIIPSTHKRKLNI